MRRREFLLGCAAAAFPSRALAQQSPRKIGFVSWFRPTVAVHAEEFRKGLRERGYVEGRDFQIEVHFTDGNREKTREILERLVRDGVDILVVSATPAIQVAKETTRTIPIVMAPVADAIAGGFAQSLARPGGNLTGVSSFTAQMSGKRIDLIREIRPGLRTLAFLGSSKDANAATFVRHTKAETDRSGLKLNVHLVEGPDHIDEGVFQAMRREGAEAVIVQPIFSGHQERIVGLATKAQLPVISDRPMFAEAGAVFTYGVDDAALLRRAAYYVDRIFKGASPADLPIELPTKFHFAVNVEAARRLGWSIPSTVLARADEVIE